MRLIEFEEQLDLDQKRYSRYVCDSRAIPNAIDGLKPVQRRILWTMWNSKARNNFVKTVKVAGMTMSYHPHGNVSIEEALSGLVQNFTFTNNYPLVAGEGTFGDELDPKAIASPRYTEVKLSDFAKEVGLFESLPDIEYALNYDESEREPIFFCPKVPLALLNPISGIATGFRCNLAGHRLRDVARAMARELRGEVMEELRPWHRGFSGFEKFEVNEKGQEVHITGFGFREDEEKRIFLAAAPRGWNREKVVGYLEGVRAENSQYIREYLDRSRDTFDIEVIMRRGVHWSLSRVRKLFSRINREVVISNVISYGGKLEGWDKGAIIRSFLEYRIRHLVARFNRLKGIEAEKIARLSELIRFIKEGWNKRVHLLKGKGELQSGLRAVGFVYYGWLSELPIYRLTKEEVLRSREGIKGAKREFKNYDRLSGGGEILKKFMIKEAMDLAAAWDRD